MKNISICHLLKILPSMLTVYHPSFIPERYIVMECLDGGSLHSYVSKQRIDSKVIPTSLFVSLSLDIAKVNPQIRHGIAELHIRGVLRKLFYLFLHKTIQCDLYNSLLCITK